MVKDRIGLERGDNTKDYLIASALAYADGYIDADFTRVSTTVPATTPQLIKDASADLAAYYMLRSTKPELAETFHQSGLRNIAQYITATYFKGVFERSSQM